MLHCKNYYTATQKNELPVVSGMPMFGQHRLPRTEEGDKMSKTVALGRAPSPTLFARLLSIIDRVLMTNAHIAVRNGDLPYFGL
jgi:hypothetical protein